MPIYEYYCLNCKKDISIFFLSFSEAEDNKPACPECGDERIERLLSKVNVVQNQKNSKEGKSPKHKPEEDDSKFLASTMHTATHKSRVDYGDDFKEVADRLEKGESSTSIEKSLRKRVGETMQTH